LQFRDAEMASAHSDIDVSDEIQSGVGANRKKLVPATAPTLRVVSQNGAFTVTAGFRIAVIIG